MLIQNVMYNTYNDYFPSVLITPMCGAIVSPTKKGAVLGIGDQTVNVRILLRTNLTEGG